MVGTAAPLLTLVLLAQPHTIEEVIAVLPIFVPAEAGGGGALEEVLQSVEDVMAHCPGVGVLRDEDGRVTDAVRTCSADEACIGAAIRRGGFHRALVVVVGGAGTTTELMSTQLFDRDQGRIATANASSRPERRAERVREQVLEVLGPRYELQGELELELEPPDATAEIDGRGSLQSRFVRLPPGAYDLRVERQGYAPRRVPFEVQAGRRTPLSVVLDALEVEPSGASLTAELLFDHRSGGLGSSTVVAPVLGATYPLTDRLALLAGMGLGLVSADGGMSGVATSRPRIGLELTLTDGEAYGAAIALEAGLPALVRNRTGTLARSGAVLASGLWDTTWWRQAGVTLRPTLSVHVGSRFRLGAELSFWSNSVEPSALGAGIAAEARAELGSAFSAGVRVQHVTLEDDGQSSPVVICIARDVRLCGGDPVTEKQPRDVNRLSGVHGNEISQTSLLPFIEVEAGGTRVRLTLAVFLNEPLGGSSPVVGTSLGARFAL